MNVPSRFRAPLATLVPVFLAACGGEPAWVEAPEPDRVPVHTVAAVPDSAPDPIVVPGRVARDAERTLAFRSPGIVEAVEVDVGDPVRAGQPVARLRTVDATSRLESARADARRAARTVERFERLHVDSVVALATLQDARDRSARADAAVDAAAEEFDRAVLRAPSAGRVTARLVEADEWVGPGTPVVHLSAGDRWTVDAALSDRDALRVGIGTPAEATSDALPGTVLSGRVTRTGAGADPGTGTFPVEVTLDGSDAPLRSGLVVRLALLPPESGGGVSLPPEAVVEARNGEGTVFVVEADTARPRTVEIVAVGAGRVRVRGGGVGPGAPVVTTGAAYLRAGTPVRVVSTPRRSAGGGFP